MKFDKFSVLFSGTFIGFYKANKHHVLNNNFYNIIMTTLSSLKFDILFSEFFSVLLIVTETNVILGLK